MNTMIFCNGCRVGHCNRCAKFEFNNNDTSL